MLSVTLTMPVNAKSHAPHAPATALASATMTARLGDAETTKALELLRTYSPRDSPDLSILRLYSCL